MTTLQSEFIRLPPSSVQTLSWRAAVPPDSGLWLQILWGAGVEQLAHDRGLAQQVCFNFRAVPCCLLTCSPTLSLSLQ